MINNNNNNNNDNSFPQYHPNNNNSTVVQPQEQQQVSALPQYNEQPHPQLQPHSHLQQVQSDTTAVYRYYNGVNPEYPGLQMIHPLPTPIYVVHDFLTADECNFLIQAASDSFAPAPVVGKGTGEISPSRTSSTCYLAREDVWGLLEKVSTLTGKPIEHCELPQVGRYLPSQYYHQHFDAFNLNEEDGRRFASNGGQRTVTVLIYLNTVEQGGATSFPTLQLSVQPRQGMAVIFFPATVDGQLDPNTLHAAMPAINVKFVSQIWIRQEKYYGVPSKRLIGVQPSFNVTTTTTTMATNTLSSSLFQPSRGPTQLVPSLDSMPQLPINQPLPTIVPPHLIPTNQNPNSHSNGNGNDHSYMAVTSTASSASTTTTTTITTLHHNNNNNNNNNSATLPSSMMLEQQPPTQQSIQSTESWDSVDTDTTNKDVDDNDGGGNDWGVEEQTPESLLQLQLQLQSQPQIGYGGSSNCSSFWMNHSF